jgi:hypothetical protein
MAFAAGLEVVEDKGLLAEVAGLVEWPVVLMGEIGADFLDLPPEVLQTSMKEHQKFFSVRDPKTGRIERFITVANRETADHGATILAGNQKVLSARLSDAKFFWENDLRVAKAGMGAWQEALKSVTFERRWAPSPTGWSGSRRWPPRSRRVVGADPDQARDGRAHRQGRSAFGDGLRIPRASGRHGPLLRRGRRPPARDRGGGGGALRPARPVRRRADRAPVGRRGAGREDRHADGASGRSTRSRRGRRTPSRCAGRRWA